MWANPFSFKQIFFNWKQTFFICQQNFFLFMRISLLTVFLFVIAVTVMGHCKYTLFLVKFWSNIKHKLYKINLVNIVIFVFLLCYNMSSKNRVTLLEQLTWSGGKTMYLVKRILRKVELNLMWRYGVKYVPNTNQKYSENWKDLPKQCTCFFRRNGNCKKQ